MASYTHSSPKSHKNEEIGFEKPMVNGDGKRIKDDMEFRSQLELLLHKELHKSFDLNQSMIPQTQLDSGEILNLQVNYQNNTINKVGKRRLKNDTKKKSPMSMALRDESFTNHGLDLELRLSTQQYQSSSSTPIFPKITTSCPPFDLNSKHQDFDCAVVSEAADHDQVKSLVLMGCANCYLYVMVPKSDPKCPKCLSSILIDEFRGNPSAKRPRI